MFLEQSLIERVLLVALSTGGDFAEIFAENTTTNTMRMIDNKVDLATSGRLYGAGIRIMKGLNSVYATTNDLSPRGLMACAKRAAGAMTGKSEQKELCLVTQIPTNKHAIAQLPASIALAQKVELVKEGYHALTDFSKEIVQASASIAERDQTVLIANSTGLLVTDRRVYTRASLMALASDGTENQTGYEAPGVMKGFEAFGADISMKKSGRAAAKQAVTMLHAKNCPAGVMPVAIENGFGGVLFHEACGHSLEATSVAKGNSEFSGRMGERIAGEKVTAIDDGTMANAWGSINIDDEGKPSQRNVLIENGVLTGYLVDRLGGRRMNAPTTGSARRESYQFAPTSRMTNTFIQKGKDDNKDIIASMEYGLYAAKMGGGSVNPTTGEFNFAVAEGYLVKDGQIGEPVRGASLIGKGSAVLLDIDMVGKNLAHGTGMCGSVSGSIPVTVGQPLIRIGKMTVGGRTEE